MGFPQLGPPWAPPRRVALGTATHFAGSAFGLLPSPATAPDEAADELLYRAHSGDDSAVLALASMHSATLWEAARSCLRGRRGRDDAAEVWQSCLLAVVALVRVGCARGAEFAAALPRAVRRCLRKHPVTVGRGGRRGGGGEPLARAALPWAADGADIAALRGDTLAAFEDHERAAFVELVAELSPNPCARIYVKEVAVPLLPGRPASRREAEVLRALGLDVAAAEPWRRASYLGPLARDAAGMDAMADLRRAVREPLAALLHRLGGAVPAAHRIVLRETLATPHPLGSAELAASLRIRVGEVEEVRALGLAYEPGALERQLAFAFTFPAA